MVACYKLRASGSAPENTGRDLISSKSLNNLILDIPKTTRLSARSKEVGMETQSQAPSGSEDTKTASTKSLRRACDCCRKRKVKCDGEDPCTPCKKASIRCAYLQPPKKKGPKGLRSARVLHALRRIDDTASSLPASPDRMPQHNGEFGNWAWGTPSQSQSPTSGPYSDQSIPPPSSLPYGPPTSMPQQPAYFHNVELPPLQNPPPPPSRQHHYAQSVPYRQDSAQSWSHSEPRSANSETLPSMNSPPEAERYSQSLRLPSETFLPYVQLFVNHMIPIMPVIDRNRYLDPNFYTSQLPPDIYCFLCALCATTVVQLDASIPTPPALRPGAGLGNDDVFADECYRVRKDWDYISHTSSLSVMTSFFLFCYYGNHEQHGKAWYYLQESITFAENHNLDDESAYTKLDPVESQWRRRLYWLLFITERAYAVQRRKHTRLSPTITLPAVLESEDPELLNGFVNLAHLFSAVDDNFVSAWRGSRRQSLCTEVWLAKTQRNLDEVALALEHVTETQSLDISITREWLHVLAWQMGVSNGLIWGQGEGGMRLDYPIELARKVVAITTGANAAALDSHGIGMEQKLSDIAGCLADVLKCTAGDTSPTFAEGKYYLSILLHQLSTIRGKESRYLKPLMEKMEGLVDYDDNIPVSLPPPTIHMPLPTPSPRMGEQMVEMEVADDYAQQQRMKVPSFSQGSMEMLRSLSVSGNLGMPALQADMWERRPSGRFMGEEGWGAVGGR